MITLVVGDSDSDARNTFTMLVPSSYSVDATLTQHPRELQELAEEASDGDTIITNSLFLIREIYMLTQREHFALRYAYKGSFFDELPAESGILEADLDQSSRYMDLENNES